MVKLYNTLTRKKQIFKPLKSRFVSIYTCGPTVYWYAHLGNLRTYVFEDVLRRTLKYNNYKVKQVMNITDVEDKIIKKAEAENKTIYEITKPYAKIFFGDLKKINIEKAEFYPKATDYIKEMIGLIKILMKNGVAYQGEDGSVYFNVSKFKNYGKLSQLKKRQLKIGARISNDEYTKEQAQDFVLWKHAKSAPLPTASAIRTRPYKYKTINKEPVWLSPWGWGRPGWHIECSAMAMKLLGKTIDIHAGAVDLIFPHHENEISQSEAATNKKFSNYWLHGEHLLVGGEKMSKSLGNFFTLRDIENKKFNPLAFRYLILTAHYRSKLNFTWESLQAAQNALKNLYEAIRCDIPPTAGTKLSRLRELPRETQAERIYQKQFLSAINDDLNMPKAIALVWQIIKDNQLSGDSKKELIIKFDEVLGLGLKNIKPVKIPLKIKQMADEREKLRANKQFIPADLLRKKIEQLGYTIEDTSYGPEITSTKY